MTRKKNQFRGWQLQRYNSEMRELGWRQTSLWLMPDVRQAIERFQERNGIHSFSSACTILLARGAEDILDYERRKHLNVKHFGEGEQW
jgi:hypothetical protein